MKDIHYSISINASKEKVWDTMLGEKTYPVWADVFMPGSYFTGTWEKGTTMDFLVKDEDGVEAGMRARVADSVPYTFVSLEHVAMVTGGEETPFNNEEVTFENYSFKEHDGVTDVVVDLHLPEEWVEMMGEAWPKALAILKELCEK